MGKNDWYEAGEAIRNLVQNAVENQDFTQLSSTITKVINQTADGFQDALRESLFGRQRDDQNGQAEESQKRRQDRRNDGRRERTADRFGDYYADEGGRTQNRRERNSDPFENGADYDQNSGAAGNYRYRMGGMRFSGQEAAERIRRNLEAKKQEIRPVVKSLRAPGLITGRIMAVTGYGFGGMFGLVLVILAAVGGTEGGIPDFVYIIMGILTGLNLWMGALGSRRLGLGTRFRRYMTMLGDRTWCTLEELASGTGKTITYIRKDVKEMLRRGFFREGHLDRKETCLITDNATYQQYLLAQQEADRRAVFGQEEPVKDEAADDPDDSLDHECRELIAEGRRYIAHIRECNDRIPGEEISAKLDRLELVVTRIFREVERRPKLAPELRKMMSYYLPTTQKLIDAYCQFDEQQISGQNIDSTKKEIENALDTINQAFENLLDGFFENTAWDISSDISVLHTMFAQEGLMGKGFPKSGK